MIKLNMRPIFAFAISFFLAQAVYAFPNNYWFTPSFQTGERLEVVRTFECFNEGRAGERTTYKPVQFSNNVLSAEVFLSGFNMWYTKEKHDHEVMQDRIDSWICGISEVDKRFATVKLMYSMKDEHVTDSDDYNDACIAFTVIALTKTGESSKTPHPSSEGDLSAKDWCYTVYEATGKISFFPIIKNLGCADWASKKTGYYKIGVSVGPSIKEIKHTLTSFPSWWLGLGQQKKLNGITLPFHPDNEYGLANIWVLHHPEDINQKNNSNKGVSGYLKGKDFLKTGKMSNNICK